MKLKPFEIFLGLNIASVVRGIRFGSRDLNRASLEAYRVATQLESYELRTIPIVNLGEILGERKPNIKLRVMKYEDGMLPYRDALALFSILVAETPGEVLEIGTYMGHTTRLMAENLEDATIHTLDLPPDYNFNQNQGDLPPKDDFHLIGRRIVGREFKGQPCEHRIVQHFGDSAVMDFKTIGQPDFFFIDGSHTYEYCLNDSNKCFELCGGKGTFLWHDCDDGHPGVFKMLQEWRRLGRKIIRIENTALAYWKSF